MSLLPSLLLARNYDCDPWDIHPRRRNWDEFGLGVTFPEIQWLAESPLSHWRRPLSGLKKSGDIIPHVGKDGFQVTMDVQQFRPNEITVKNIDNTVIVEGKHDERQDDHGAVYRHFVRKYTLPQGYDPHDIHSSLSSDGFLTIKAPPPSKKLAGKKERMIEIQHTGPAHLHLKENVTKEDKEKNAEATTNG